MRGSIFCVSLACIYFLRVMIKCSTVRGTLPVSYISYMFAIEGICVLYMCVLYVVLWLQFVVFYCQLLLKGLLCFLLPSIYFLDFLFATQFPLVFFMFFIVSFVIFFFLVFMRFLVPSLLTYAGIHSMIIILPFPTAACISFWIKNCCICCIYILLKWVP